ncbi:acyltransferase [Phycicoccus sp. SLBN-51]|uniref:acyltransferase n=1 Tax=Phycicoccus sp. SLBN-51 TaxID=2768447 RepID=UPI001150560A|nr:acyltransferase [Phycicoccus sp. SLBN-51]TQJ49869.1 transferase family hexapeptide repeat protein [Phycicoccus sp. SLBN-51]
MVNLSRLTRAYRYGSRHARGRMLAALIRLGGGQCGPGLEVEAGTTLRWAPHRGLQIGSNVRFGRGVILDVPEGGELVLGDGVKIMHYTVVAAFARVEIGAGSQIGESCSIRDSDHGVGDATNSLADSNISDETRLGQGVWLGRGVAVLRGSTIGDFARVGANSVVLGSRPIPAGAIAVGAPAIAKA